MFDVGFWEIVLIFGLGLMVLGPEKLSKIAAQVGRWVGRARRTANQLRYQLEREIDLGDKPRQPYTPPPKTSHIVPPPGKQTSKPAAESAESEAASPDSKTADEPTPDGGAGRERDIGT